MLASKFGEYAEAIALFGETIHMSSSGSEAEINIHAVACNNLAQAIADSGKTADLNSALWLIERAHKLLAGQVRTPARYRLYRVEASVLDRLGSHRKAERLYRSALNGLEHLQLPWECALVGLDLCALLHLVGELEELTTVAAQTFRRFRTLSGASTQALATISLWADAVRMRAWEEAEETKEKPGARPQRYDRLHADARRMILDGVVRGSCCSSRRSC